MKDVKIGILGFGSMGQLHLKNCLLIRNLKVVVADKSKSALRKAREIGVKETYEDYKELLQKASVDGVVITLPNFLHKESACLAAENGVDVFVEKPLARTSEECQSILQSVKENGVRLMVGFYQRFLDRNQNLKFTVENGDLGDVALIVYELMSSSPFSHRFPPSPVPDWWFDAKMVGGGALIDTGSHMIDLIRWLLNDEASVHYVFLGYKFRMPMEDMAVLSLHFRKGAMALLMISWSASSNPLQRIDLHGTAGSLSLGDLTSTTNTKRVLLEIMKNVARRFQGKEIKPYSLSEASRAYYKELEHFVNCIREDKEPCVTGKDGLECAKLIDEAYRLWSLTDQLNKEYSA